MLKKTFSKFFANKIINFPEKLKTKNPVKQKKTYGIRGEALSNLLKTERLGEHKNELQSIFEKTSHEQLVLSAAKVMNINFYKIYDDSNDTNLLNLYKFVSKTLNIKETHNLLAMVRETSKSLTEKQFENTEFIFKIFLDKLYSLSDSANVNESIINLFTKINFSKLSLKELYLQNKLENNISASNSENANSFNIQRAIHFSQLEANELISAQPLYRDVGRSPENDYKDVRFYFYTGFPPQA